MAIKYKTQKQLPILKLIIAGMIAIATGYILISQKTVLILGVRQLHTVEPGSIFGAVVFVGATFLLGAAIYVRLAFKNLNYGRTLIVQIGANFINRIVPAGIGGIGVNYRYLRKQGHSPAQAASVVAANNGLGLLGHALLLLVLISAFGADFSLGHVNKPVLLVIGSLVAFSAIVLVGLPALRRRLLKQLGALKQQLQVYAQRKSVLVTSLFLEICLTLCNVTAFWLCALSLGVHIPFVAALIIFTLGVGVGSAAPTPGGLGGVEAGLVGGLIVYHVASPQAVAVALVYRLVGYWLPLIISAPVCFYARRRQYF